MKTVKCPESRVPKGSQVRDAECAALRKRVRVYPQWTGHLDTHDHGKRRSKVKAVKSPGTLVDTYSKDRPKAQNHTCSRVNVP